MMPNLSALTPLADMAGEDDEETALLKGAQREAAEFIASFGWVRSIRECYFGAGVGGVVAAFLFKLDLTSEDDEWLWVIVGDLPPAYLVIDRAPNGLEAIKVYCELMEEWARLVRVGGNLGSAFPVAAQPTVENALALEKRIMYLRSRIIPALARP
jgi:hypothetical protein